MSKGILIVAEHRPEIVKSKGELFTMEEIKDITIGKGSFIQSIPDEDISPGIPDGILVFRGCEEYTMLPLNSAANEIVISTYGELISGNVFMIRLGKGKVLQSLTKNDLDELSKLFNVKLQ